MQIKTICRDCIFASFQEGDDYKEQTGCQLKRLEKFQDICPDKVKIETEENTTFYSIEKICTYCRNEEWAKKNKSQNLLEIIQKEIAPKIDFVVLADTLPQALTSIKSVLQQTIKPESITFICKDVYLCEDVRQYLVKNSNGINFKSMFVVDKDKAEDKIINDGVQQGNGNYYTVLADGKIIPQNHTQQIFNIIHNDLKQPLVFYNKDGHPSRMTINRNIHELTGGNRERTVIDKVAELAQEQNRMDMLIAWDDINEP